MSKSDTVGTIPDKVWKRLQKIAAKLETAEGREGTLVDERNSIDKEIGQLNPQEETKREDLHARWSKVVHAIDAVRAFIRTTNKKMRQTITDAGQGTFDWDDEEEMRLPPEPDLFTPKEPGAKPAGEYKQQENGTVANLDTGIPIETLLDHGVADRTVAKCRKNGWTTGNAMENRQPKQRLTMDGFTPKEEQQISEAIEEITKGSLAAAPTPNGTAETHDKETGEVTKRRAKATA